MAIGAFKNWVHDEQEKSMRRRSKGWRMPAGAVCVTRGTRWGNPFRIGDSITRAVSIELFRRHLIALGDKLPGFLEPLRGRDLACFCALDDHCHADILLELANQGIGIQTSTQE